MIRGILLAAGASRRMGCDKLALPWRDGTVLSSALAAWTSVPGLHEVLLVRRTPTRDGDPPRVRTLVNAGADEGMGSSLRVAAEALPPDTEAVLVGLADMPGIAPATLGLLLEAWRPLGPRGIVAPVFRGRRGHPVVFGAAHLPALRELRGDRGARDLLRACAAEVTGLPVGDPGVLFDIDTPADLGTAP